MLSLSSLYIESITLTTLLFKKVRKNSFKKLSICLCLFLAVFLTSCSNRVYQDHEVVLSDVKAEKQAVIVFKARGGNPRFSFAGGERYYKNTSKGPKVSFDLVKVEPNCSKALISKVFYRVKPGFFNKMIPWSSNELHVLMIQPGFYVIDNISWTVDGFFSITTKYTSAKHDFPSLCPVVAYGGFEVKPGTVNYLGDLEFRTKDVENLKCELIIKHHDQFSEAKEELRKDNPDLAESLVPTEFFHGGHCYIRP